MIEAIQQALQTAGIDGWLFFDHHHRDPIAYRILGLEANTHASRRWYYFVPAQGEPRKLVHRIEAQVLDGLEGTKFVYSAWTEQHQQLRNLTGSAKRIAMQYSPNCEVPYVSHLDGGTLELLRAFGLEVVTSGDLVQEFESRWTEAQYDSHKEAGRLVDQVRVDAFRWIGEHLQSRQRLTEYQVQQFILQRFAEDHLQADHGPIVAVDANASDPHYEPTRDRTESINPNQVVLIDLWAKLRDPGSVYYDVTWVGYSGSSVPDDVSNVFSTVVETRRAATRFVTNSVASGALIRGWQVDDVARNYISSRGFGGFFFHRTGHNIGTEVHGTGANMDNFESHDDRLLISQTCFSVEPGIYLPSFGIRSEVNVFVGVDKAWVTGAEQERLVSIL